MIAAAGATGRLSPGRGRLLVIRRGSSSSCSVVSMAGALTWTGGVGSTTATGRGAGGGVGAATGSTSTTGTTGSTTGGSGLSSASTTAGAAFLAAAFFTGAASVAASVGSTALAAAAFLAADFLTGLTSSGCSSRVNPSRTARRSSRSACASMRVLECVFTPTPIVSHSAIISALVIPSFLASSCTRMFFAKTSSAFRWHRRAGVCSDGR